jgi:DUF1016 N-terminal domain
MLSKRKKTAQTLDDGKGNPLPAVYDSFLQDLKDRIRTAQLRAALSVNRELVLLYWSVGRDILTRQENEGWGVKIIDRLSDDLTKAFPEMRGFRARNLKYMRAFAEAYPRQGICATGCCTIALGASGENFFGGKESQLPFEFAPDQENVGDLNENGEG